MCLWKHRDASEELGLPQVITTALYRRIGGSEGYERVLLSTVLLNPLDAIGVSLNKQKLMYNRLAPSIIAIYKFLCTYGGYILCKWRPKGFNNDCCVHFIDLSCYIPMECMHIKVRAVMCTVVIIS